MSRKWFSVLALIAIATLFLSFSSCAYNQHLVSINIPESGGTFGVVDPNAFFDFKAFGTYIHPPQTKDITNLVTWQSDNPQVVQVSSVGVVSPNLGCGVGNVYATFQDGSNNIVSNSVKITVNGPAALGCTPPGPQPALTISFAGTGTGTVTGPGISCSSPSSFTNTYTLGTTITLTAFPTGTSSSFGNWSGCNSTNGTACTVVLENSVTVTATFN
jgi:hypothetical protein